MTDALRFEAVTFTYTDAEVPALREVDLGLAEGTFSLAMGPTGAGKSTFLRAANGLVPHFTGGAFAGRVLAEGRDTLADPPRRLADVVAFVPQDPAASFVLDRVEEELAYGMENLGVEPARVRLLRSFDPRSGAHAEDVEDPYYGDHSDFEETFTVIQAALPGLHAWVDDRLAGQGLTG